MIKVTLEFASQAELVAFFTSAPGAAQAVKVDTPKPEKATTVLKTSAAPTPTKTTEATETPKPTAAVEPTAPAASDAPAASSDVPYATLKASVLKLVAKSHDAAIALAGELGVPNFKAFEAEDRAGERAAALAAVNAKLEALS